MRDRRPFGGRYRVWGNVWGNTVWPSRRVPGFALVSRPRSAVGVGDHARRTGVVTAVVDPKTDDRVVGRGKLRRPCEPEEDRSD